MFLRIRKKVTLKTRWLSCGILLPRTLVQKTVSIGREKGAPESFLYPVLMANLQNTKTIPFNTIKLWCEHTDAVPNSQKRCACKVTFCKICTITLILCAVQTSVVSLKSVVLMRQPSSSRVWDSRDSRDHQSRIVFHWDKKQPTVCFVFLEFTVR